MELEAMCEARGFIVIFKAAFIARQALTELGAGDLPTRCPYGTGEGRFKISLSHCFYCKPLATICLIVLWTTPSAQLV
jgi:hypothetical protein